MKLPLTRLFVSGFLFILNFIVLFSVKDVYAQVPPPYVPCNQQRSPEFHSLRPYQASPCNRDATELALYCDSSFILPDTFVITKSFGDPPINRDYIYNGSPIYPNIPQDSFNQQACRYCENGVCLGNTIPCISELNQCVTSVECIHECTNNGDGTETCTFLVHRERDVAIDLSGAEFPIMGNTDDVINSQNQWGTSSFDAFDATEPLDAYDPTKVNEYVSWYLNGVIGRAEYERLDPNDPNDILKITDFSGPLKKFLSFESQIVDRINEIRRARTSLNCDPNANPRDPDCIRHNQVVGCHDSSGNPIECYPQRAAARERRLTDWINDLPPLRSAFNNFSDYWQAYSDWRTGNPRFIGNLFTYIPFSSMEDRRGIDEAVFQSIQPVQPYVRIVSATLTQIPADLFFAHIEETAELGETLQKTFAFKEANLNGPPSNISPPANAYCDLVEVRNNPGDDLFATEIQIHLEYDAQIDCSFYLPYPDPGTTEGNVCTHLLGGACHDTPYYDWDCSSYYTQVDCDPGRFCGVGCSSAGACGGPGTVCAVGGIGNGVNCCPTLDCNVTGNGLCESYFTPTSPNPTQDCPITVNVMLGTVTQTPKADELWSRFVSGPAGIFRRVFPKIEPNAPIEALWDIPASTPVTFTAPGLVYVGIPGSGRTQPELYFPHIGGIHQYFLKCIQRALRPQGFGEPCISGSPGTNAPTDGTCPNVPDSAIPAKWLGGMKSNFINLANMWCGGNGENMADECYNYVVQQSIAAGVNPAFSLSIWLHETAASNYTCSGAGAQDFGINDPSIAMNLVAQLARFLTLPYSSTYLYCRSQALASGADPMFGFLDRFRDGNCDLTASASNAGWGFYLNMKTVWEWVTGPLRICTTPTRFGIHWPTDFACP